MAVRVMAVKKTKKKTKKAATAKNRREEARKIASELERALCECADYHIEWESQPTIDWFRSVDGFAYYVPGPLEIRIKIVPKAKS